MQIARAGSPKPRYEVEPADVDVGWDTTQVRVPDVDIRTQGETLRR